MSDAVGDGLDPAAEQSSVSIACSRSLIFVIRLAQDRDEFAVVAVGQKSYLNREKRPGMVRGFVTRSWFSWRSSPPERGPNPEPPKEDHTSYVNRPAKMSKVSQACSRINSHEVGAEEISSKSVHYGEPNRNFARARGPMLSWMSLSVQWSWPASDYC